MKRFLKKSIILLLVGSLMFALFGCIFEKDEQEDDTYLPEKTEGKPLVESIPETKETEVPEDFFDALLTFYLDNFNQILSLRQSSNTLFSPLSASVCLAMLTNGADNNTLKQLEEAYGCSVDELNAGLNDYLSNLITSEDCFIRLADSIWTRDDDGLKLQDGFVKKVKDYYNAEVFSVPFTKETKDDINQWVSDKTDGLIPTTLDDAPSADTVMYLINTLLFKGKWENEYADYMIRKGETFTDYGGKEEKVNMLCSTESTYYKGEDYVGTKIYYDTNQYSFIGLLPNEDVDVYDFAKSLTSEKWKSIFRSKQKKYKAYVRLPEFSFKDEIQLNDVWGNLGLTDMFSPSNADFSKLGTINGGNIYCSRAFQKSYISVTKTGTEASAVTVIEMKCTSVGPEDTTQYAEVYFDRPFVFAIIDNEHNMPLFIGVVNSIEG